MVRYSPVPDNDLDSDSPHAMNRRHNQPRATVLELVGYVAYTLSLIAVVGVLGKCMWMGLMANNSRDIGDSDRDSLSNVDPLDLELEDSTSTQSNQPSSVVSKGHKPCCLPFKFQAVITPLTSFDAQTKRIMHLYRDWGNQLQAMEQTTFDDNGIAPQSYAKTIYDYKNNNVYQINTTTRKCVAGKINSGMLEPCMPDDSKYLGKSYVGLYGDKANFHSFYFQRQDKNRSIEMTISVTSDKCIPIMEHIRGRIGSGVTDSLVFFSNITSLYDQTVFDVPDFCFNKPNK